MTFFDHYRKTAVLVRVTFVRATITKIECMKKLCIIYVFDRCLSYVIVKGDVVHVYLALAHTKYKLLGPLRC